MFCYLYKLENRTGLPLSQYEKCDSECKYCKDSGCRIAKVVNSHLSDNKFGWIIEDHILFDVPVESKSALTQYIAAISLIHPSENDVWIVFYKRLSKRDDSWSTSYKFYQNGEMKDFENLGALNSFLIKSGFKGRKITESDLLLMKG